MAEQAFPTDVSQHRIMKIAHLQVYKEHSMLQLHILRPFIPQPRHTCSLMRVITLQGAPTSFHKWDSKQLITQSLPENIPNLALPGAPNAISAKLCPHSLCSLRAQSQDSENNPLGRLLRRIAKVPLNLGSSGEQHFLPPPSFL